MTTEHRMPAARAALLVTDLAAAGVAVCVGGGWAADALLSEQTRAHSDLDVWLPAPDLESAFRVLGRHGVDRVLPWPGDRPWNFVLHDGATTRVDLHLYEPIDDDVNHYGSSLGEERFPVSAVRGTGRIAGREVVCESPEWMVRWHTGFPARDQDAHDVLLVCERYGIDVPDGYRDRSLDVRVRVAPEYGAGPLWWEGDRLGPVERGDLPISPGLEADLQQWQQDWDDTLDPDHPPDSRFASAPDERSWRRRGDELVDRLWAELGPAAVVRHAVPGSEWSRT